ncbi:MAG: hypothetical protein IH946_11300 [Bacteroidetes bacterium]|nr:hypothetical protein [Bacteroidota bacterium]
MRTRLLSIALVASVIFAACSPKTATTTSASSSDQGVRLENIGEILSTYDLNGDDKAKSAIDSSPDLSASDKTNVYANSTEKSWPTGLANLTNRYNNSGTIKNYKATQVASFPNSKRGTLYVIRVASADNGHMTGDFALTEDIYLVMTAKGFARK